MNKFLSTRSTLFPTFARRLGLAATLQFPLLALGAVLLTPSSAEAQLSGGTITGSVVDPSGAAINGAQVVVTNTTTNISQTLTSQDAGLFTVPNVNPGPYNVTVTLAGFKEGIVPVTVEIGKNSVIKVTLEIGNVGETVTAQANSSPVVDLDASSLNQAVDGKTIRELPLNGRDWTSLAVLEPGVHTVDNQLSISAGDNSRSNRGVGTQISIGGTRPQQNNYRLDGITTNDYSGAGPGGALGGTLGVDAIQEFNVVTSNPSADFGRTSGGTIAAVTRAGTNKFHGSAYEFIRNSALDASNFFTVGSKSLLQRNQFGGAIGGPIVRDKAFFFFNYEGLRQNRSFTTTDTVPTALARTGTLYNAKTGTYTTIVPVNPAVVPYLALFPLPQNNIANSDVGSYTFSGKAVARENLYTGRLDYTINQKDAIHFTGLWDPSTDTQPDGYNFKITGLDIQRKTFSLNEAHTFSPTLANFFRIGYNYAFALAPAGAAPIDPRSTDTTLGFIPGATVGTIQVSGLNTFFGGVGAEGTYSFHYNSYQLGDDVYWTKGKHTLQLGYSMDLVQSNNRGNTTNGFYTFNSYANFLAASPSAFSSNIPGKGIPIYLRQTQYGGYAMDAWHLLPNLTVNLGVRYEPVSDLTEKYGHLATLTAADNPTLKVGGALFNNPSLKNFSPRVGVAWDPFKQGKTSIRASYGIYDTLPLSYIFNLATLTTAPFGQTASLTNVSALAGTFPKQSYNIAINSPGTNKVAYIQQNPGRAYVQQYMLTVQQELAPNTSLEVGYTGAHGVRQPLKSNDANIVLPTNNDYANLTWPSFNCTSTNKCSTLANGTIVGGVTSGQKQNPTLGTIDTTLFNESTIYNALNASIRRNTARMRLGLSYTWSKSLDESSSSNAGTNFSNSLIAPYPTVINRFKGLSDFNVQNNLVVNALYNLPSPKRGGLVRLVGGGYQVGGIARSATGLPFTPLITGDQLGLSNANPFSFPDRLYGAGCTQNPVNGIHTINDAANFLNRSCFGFPTTVQTSPTLSATSGSYIPHLGNLRRNSIVGPGLNTINFSLVKNTAVSALSENARMEFRAEIFNILNHPNFAVPSRTSAAVYNANGGALSTAVISSTSSDERQIQFGLKLIF